jgi:uncharacterized protein (DUF1499 family)
LLRKVSGYLITAKQSLPIGEGRGQPCTRNPNKIAQQAQQRAHVKTIRSYVAYTANAL